MVDVGKKPGPISAIVAALMLLVPALVAPPASPEGSGDYPPPEQGDWVVSRDTRVSSETIRLRGNLTVGNCSLSLEEVSLAGNLSGAPLSITVTGGGSLRARGCGFSAGSSQELALHISGAAELSDCTFSGAVRAHVSGSCRSLSTALPADGVSVLSGGQLELLWRLRTLITNPDGTPAPGASVSVTDALGRVVATALTDGEGAAGPLTLPELVRFEASSLLFTPYFVNASKGGLRRSLSVNLNRDVELVMALRDIDPPWVRITWPENGTLTNHSALELRGEAGDGVGLERVRVRAGAGEWVEASGRETWSASLALPDGRWTIEVEALDRAGNSASTAVAVIIDTAPPLLRVTAPAGEVLTSSPTVEVTGAAEPGCTLTIDGEPVPVIYGSFRASVALSEGPNRVELEARDAAGNRALSWLEVTLDTIPPWLTVATPGDGALTNRSEVEVAGAAEEGALVLVSGAAASRDGPFFSARVGLVEGENRVVVRAIDGASNVASVELRVYLDSTPPQIRVSAADGAVSLAPSIQVSGYTEPGSALFLNGAALSVSGDGWFEEEVPLRIGRNALVFTARDPAGNSARLEIAVVREEPLEGTPAGAGGGGGGAPPAIAAAVVALASVAALVLFAVFVRRRREAH